MTAFLYELPFVQDVNGVGILDGRQPMGYDYCRYVGFRKVVQSLLDLFLVFPIESRGCLI